MNMRLAFVGFFVLLAIGSSVVEGGRGPGGGGGGWGGPWCSPRRLNKCQFNCPEACPSNPTPPTKTDPAPVTTKKTTPPPTTTPPTPSTTTPDICSCQCSDKTFEKNGKTYGNCQAKFGDGHWCYITQESFGKCSDTEASKQFSGSFWSYEACANRVHCEMAPK